MPQETDASARDAATSSGFHDVPAARQPAPEAHMARFLRPRVLGVPVATLALLAFAAFVILTNYIPTRIDTLGTEMQLENQQIENISLADRIRIAELRTRQVETDRWTNERILRDDLHMMRKGEALIR